MPQMKAIHEIHKGSKVIKPSSKFSATEIEAAELLKHGAAELLGEDSDTAADTTEGTQSDKSSGKAAGKAAGKAGKAGQDSAQESEDNLIG